MLPKSQPTELLELGDPRAIRALAHPVRLAILELVREDGSATATECAHATGESPQACSYHLRTLAKWGLVRRVESADGRETRWGAAARGFRFGGGAASPELDAAGSALTNRVIERDDSLLADFVARAAELEHPWRDSGHFVSANVHMTADELRGLEEEIGRVIRRYRRDRTDRPPGGRRVHLVFRAFPVIDERRRKKR